MANPVASVRSGVASICLEPQSEEASGSQAQPPGSHDSQGVTHGVRPFGHKEVANKKPDHYLEWYHPKTVALREYMNKKEITHEIHPRLVTNFDQVSIVCKVN